MIEKLYSDFDTAITIRSTNGKTFSEKTIDIAKIKQVEGVAEVSRAIEEIIVIKHEKKWVNANLVGVDESFLTMSKMRSHLVDGELFLKKGGQSFGIIGASLLDKLGGYIPREADVERVILYAPKRDVKAHFGSNPFRVEMLPISARMNFNREINAENIVVPLSFANELLGYDDDITRVFVSILPTYSKDEVKAAIQKKVGKGFELKTNFEKNELIFKTSKSEKFIVFVILIFIFILAAFNLIASITMLFVEKKENIQTLIACGADQQTVFSIFLFEGLLIAGKGVLLGLLLGYGICLLQLKSALLTMPSSDGEPFPIQLSWSDGLLIVGSVTLLSFLFSYLPVYVLLKKNFGHLKF